jgi:hypothetical protein
VATLGSAATDAVVIAPLVLALGRWHDSPETEIPMLSKTFALAALLFAASSGCHTADKPGLERDAGDLPQGDASGQPADASPDGPSDPDASDLVPCDNELPVTEVDFLYSELWPSTATVAHQLLLDEVHLAVLSWSALIGSEHDASQLVERRAGDRGGPSRCAVRPAGDSLS